MKIQGQNITGAVGNLKDIELLFTFTELLGNGSQLFEQIVNGDGQVFGQNGQKAAEFQGLAQNKQLIIQMNQTLLLLRNPEGT